MPGWQLSYSQLRERPLHSSSAGYGNPARGDMPVLLDSIDLNAFDGCRSCIGRTSFLLFARSLPAKIAPLTSRLECAPLQAPRRRHQLLMATEHDQSWRLIFANYSPKTSSQNRTSLPRFAHVPTSLRRLWLRLLGPHTKIATRSETLCENVRSTALARSGRPA